MKILIFSASIVCIALAAGGELRTKYDTERTLRVTSETELTLETTDFSLERNGEPVDTSGFGGGGGSSTTVRLEHVDKATAVSEGLPTALERHFESASRSGGEEGVDSPLDGETLVLTMDEDGDVTAELESGASPDRDTVLEGHRLTLPMDAFLPADGAEPGDSWELDAVAVLEGLGHTQSLALFPPPERPEGGSGDERGGERRRGPPGGRDAGTVSAILSAADWDASATLQEETEVADGTECWVIALELEGEGQLEEQRMWGGGRGRALGTPRALTPVMLTTEFEIEIEGRLLFSRELGRPVRLELEGDFSIEMEMTRERGEMTMTIYRAQEGTFNQTVSVTEETDAQ